MGRHARFSFPLSTGQVVGASFKSRGRYIRVQFPHPTENKFIEVTTGVPTPKGWTSVRNPPADAMTAAAKLILKHYAPILPPDLSKLRWDQAFDQLRGSAVIRPRTLQTYETAITHVSRLLHEARGPTQVTPELAQRFVRLYAGEKFRRGRASDAPEYSRSPQTVFNAIANLSIVWSHFKDLGFVRSNPWAEVKRPRLPKRVPVIPTEDSVAVFFRWLEERYPGWELVNVFVQVKMLTGCRLLDLCQVKSSQLDPRTRTLTITADQDKTHRERVIPIPDGLFARLLALRGSTHLWERYVEDTKVYRPGHTRTETFSPRVMYNAMKAIFRSYRKANPNHVIRSHDLRKRAITLMTLATQSVDQTANAIGISDQTARRYYLDAGKAFDAQSVMRKMAQVLLPSAASDTGAVSTGHSTSEEGN